MKTCILRGVPSSLRQDGWWLDPYTRARPTPDQPHAARNANRYALHALLLGVLIAVSQVTVVPQPPETRSLATHGRCGTPGDLGFHAAHDLRSLGASTQQGTPL